MFIRVPLRKVHLHSEALSEVIEHLAASGAALLHDQAQHLCSAALVEGVILAAFDQLLVDLEVCETHQSLEDDAKTMSCIVSTEVFIFSTYLIPLSYECSRTIYSENTF